MLLVAASRPGAQITVCPLLWLGALLPAPGLLALPWLGWRAWQTGEGTLWALLVISGFLLSVFAYAFSRAAIAQQVRCQRQDARLIASSHTEQLTADLSAVVMRVVKSRVGGRHPLTVYDVTLHAPGWRTPLLLHRGFTSWSARRAAGRLASHLGLPSASG